MRLHCGLNTISFTDHRSVHWTIVWMVISVALVASKWVGTMYPLFIVTENVCRWVVSGCLKPDNVALWVYPQRTGFLWQFHYPHGTSLVECLQCFCPLVLDNEVTFG